MSPWVLILMIVANSGTATSTIDMPNKATCERARSALIETGFMANIRTGWCVNREATR